MMALLQLNKLPPSCDLRLRGVCAPRARSGCRAAHVGCSPAPWHRPRPHPRAGIPQTPTDPRAQTRAQSQPAEQLSATGTQHGAEPQGLDSVVLNLADLPQSAGRVGREGLSHPAGCRLCPCPCFPLPPAGGGSGSLHCDDLRLHPHRSAPLRTRCRAAAASRGALPGVSGPGCLVQGQAQVFPSWERAGRLTQLRAGGRGSGREGTPGPGCVRTAQAQLGLKKLQASPVGLNPNHFSPCSRALWSRRGSATAPGSFPSSIPPCCLPRNAGREAEELEQAVTRSFCTAATPVHISARSTRSRARV